MKMNRLFAVLLVILIAMTLSVPALALTPVEKEQQYVSAISQLEAWLEGSHNVAELRGTYSVFKELGGFEYSKFFAYYVDVLIRIEEDQFDFQLDFDLRMLEQNGKFATYLSEDVEYAIGDLEMLHAYADARRLEYNGNTTEAAEYYANCLSFYDSSDRYERIALEEYSSHYQRGMELMNSGDLVAAYTEFSMALGWEDSSDVMAYIVEMLGYNPLEHEHDWQPATCTEPKTCTGCGNTKGEALGHQWDDGTVTIPATCISEGVMTYTCSSCGENYAENIPVNGNNHNWQEATYDAPMTCAWCGATEGKPRPLVTGNPRIEGSYVTFGHYPQTASGSKQFTLMVTDYDGNATEHSISTDVDTVGAALLEQGLVEGEEGPYGLYIKTVNGIRADYELDGHYWAFYVNGEYAVTGIDQTPVEPGTAYELRVE